VFPQHFSFLKNLNLRTTGGEYVRPSESDLPGTRSAIKWRQAIENDYQKNLENAFCYLTGSNVDQQWYQQLWCITNMLGISETPIIDIPASFARPHVFTFGPTLPQSKTHWIWLLD
jgi:hypothetical protein